jgi:hypothetical protein
MRPVGKSDRGCVEDQPQKATFHNPVFGIIHFGRPIGHCCGWSSTQPRSIHWLAREIWERMCVAFEPIMLRCSAAVANASPCVPKAVVRLAHHTSSLVARTTQGFSPYY